MRYHYETDIPDPYPDAVSIPSIVNGVAWYVMGWQTEPDEDTEWTGIENRTGQMVVKMVGDDTHYLCEPDEIIQIEREDYCSVCGQMGCSHDGYDRS
jgi:hypothetical protein